MKKESLLLITIKTLLAVVIFVGVGTIIIGGGYLIGDYYKNGVDNKIEKEDIKDEKIIQDETSDWKTYRNEEYGFEFQYPKDWENPFLNNKSEILFGCSNDDLENNKKCLLTLSFPTEFPDINYRSKTWITIDNRSAEKYIGYGFCKFIIHDYNDENKSYKIVLNYKRYSDQENQIIDQIISTFKFTKQIDVDSWNIYNNEKYGFQLRYPEGFSVINLEQTKNNLDPFYQNWIHYIFEREHFGNPIVIFINHEHKYVHFIVVHVNEKDKGSECLEDEFLIGKERQMMSKETMAREIIGESDFYKEEWREGMDGSHFLNYRTVHDSKCFMMTTNLEDGYPSNPVKMELYDKIIHSFKFIEKYESFTVEGNDIYYSDIKAGFIEGDKINIFFEDGIFSFVGDLSKMSLFIPYKFTIFSYDGLSISGGLYRANSTNSPLNITYKCDGPLRNLENVKHEYCETNKKDYLTQYEFSDLTSSGFGTGGGTVWRWYKLYIKKINGADFVFQGYLDDNLNWSNVDNWIDGPAFNSKEDKEKYERLSTKEYLDEVLTDESVIDKINKWDEFVESL